jgi:hypothetical protein
MATLFSITRSFMKAETKKAPERRCIPIFLGRFTFRLEFVRLGVRDTV